MTATGGDAQARVPAQAGEPCAQCGSPLAADQRYCLNCGKRRGAPRVDYRERMAAAAAANDRGAPPPPPPSLNGSEPPQSEKGQRDYAPLAAVGGIAVLGLMLLIGVLIGRGDGGTTTTPASVVVQGAGAAAPSGSGAAAGVSSGGDEAGLGASGGGKAKAAKAKSAGKRAAAEGAVTASEDDLAELENETGEEAAKNALKLPDKIATPGAPPPIDKSKAPGGGEGGAVTIK